MRPGTARIADQVERGARRIDEMLTVKTWNDTIERVENGSASLRDFRTLWDEVAQDVLAATMARVPSAVMRRVHEEPALTEDLIDRIASVAAHPPDEEIDPELATFCAALPDAWRHTPFPDSLTWATARLLLGKREGPKLRRRCWQQSSNAWVLAPEVEACAEDSLQPRFADHWYLLFGGLSDPETGRAERLGVKNRRFRLVTLADAVPAKIGQNAPSTLPSVGDLPSD